MTRDRTSRTNVSRQCLTGTGRTVASIGGFDRRSDPFRRVSACATVLADLLKPSAHEVSDKAGYGSIFDFVRRA